MKLITFFDTETTGLLPRFFTLDRNKIGALPHVVQLAAVLVDATDYQEVNSFNILVKPDGWEIPEAASAIHGIKQEEADKRGIVLTDAVDMFDEFLSRSVGMVAHNIDFDSKMMGISYLRTDRDPEAVFGKPRKCTMKAATPICNLPGNYPGKPKWPKLQEAHVHFFGKEFEGAHDALNDIRACVRIYKHLKTINAV